MTFVPLAEHLVDLGVEGLEVRPGVVGAAERTVPVRDAELVVVVQVVRRRDDRDHAAEALLADPDDLLLAAHPAVVLAEAARPLAHREAVLDEPGEVAGLDAQGPLAPQLGHHAAPASAMSPTSSTACTVASTSWARMRRTPCTAAHVAAAREPSMRSSTGTGVVSSPMPTPTSPGSAGALARWSLAASRRPEEGLAGDPDGDREARRHQLVEVGQQLQVVAQVLAEAEARVDPQLVDAGVPRGLGPGDEVLAHLADDVLVRRGVLHRPRVALHVHGDPAHAEPGGDLVEARPRCR